jgi:hypothetical protein
MSIALRVVYSELDSNSKTMNQYGQQQVLMTAADTSEGSILTVLGNNSKKHGSRLIVHSVANLDKEHQTASLIS